MATKKLFLVQFLIEVDVSEWPDFDEGKAVEHFRAALKLSGEDKVRRVQTYLLARMPDDPGDLTVEEYEDRGFDIEICQDANTVGTDVPTYFALVWNPQAKTPAGTVAGSDSRTIEEAKEAARLYVDKRLRRLKPEQK
jgi:hypothetical protein